MKVPDKIYLYPYSTDGIYEVETKPLEGTVEYTSTDAFTAAFIEKAAEFLYNYNQKQVLKHGARATLGCGEYTINVEEFKNYMKGD